MLFFLALVFVLFLFKCLTVLVYLGTLSIPLFDWKREENEEEERHRSLICYLYLFLLVLFSFLFSLILNKPSFLLASLHLIPLL